ncbi:MAG: hypothetical protein Q8Q47_04650, partial [Ignavibacteriaceae bacterium]|nr:hypothetical protein [Ignavibacteriaceae bacterium]
RLPNIVLLFANTLLIGSSFEFARAEILDSSLHSIQITPINIKDIVQNQSGDLYVLSGDLFHSLNDGELWRPLIYQYHPPLSLGLTYANNIVFVRGFKQIAAIENKKISLWSLDEAGEVLSIVYEKDSNYFFAAARKNSDTTYGGIYRGQLDTTVFEWPKLETGNLEPVTLALNNNKQLFAGVPGIGIYRSNDFGLNWYLINASGLNDFSIIELKTDNDNKLYLRTLFSIFTSDDFGNTWTRIIYSGQIIEGLEFDSQNNIYTAEYNRILRSTDKGNTWHQFGESLSYIRSIFVSDNNYLYINTVQGIYRSTSTVSVTNRVHIPINSFALYPNYPNPFNPITNFKFRI